MLKRIFIILPLLFALLSFKVSASILVLTGGLVSTQSSVTETKGRAIHHWFESEESSVFEEFVEEEEEDEDSDVSLSLSLRFCQNGSSTSNSFSGFVCRKVKRKLFILYQSYKIDCCKF